MSRYQHLLRLSLLLPFTLAACSQSDEQAATPAADAAAQTATAPSAQTGAVAVDDARLLRGTEDTAQWSHYGGSYNEQRYSPLAQINDTNVSQLGLAWYADYDTNQNQHGSPLVVDGVIYVSTARNVVHAFAAKSGERLWTYTPLMVPNPNLGLVNRGLGAFDGKIYMGMLDAHLVALDANTGEEVWNTDTVPASTGLSEDMRGQYSITMAPRVANGKVFVGGSGGEYGARGWVAAFNAETGAEEWRFWTVPDDPAKGYEGQPHLAEAAKTWPADIEYCTVVAARSGMPASTIR